MTTELRHERRLLGDAAVSFTENCGGGIEPSRERSDPLRRESRMLVTAINPHIGYDNAARGAKKAHAEGITLAEAAAALGLVDPADFDRMVRPEEIGRASCRERVCQDV